MATLAPKPSKPRPAWLLSLSPRLVRAGLVFIILGFAAALLPQNDMVQAITGSGQCTNGNTHTYAVYDDGGSTSDIGYNLTTNGKTSILLDVTQDGTATPFTFTSSGDTNKISAVNSGSGIMATISGSGNSKSIIIAVTFTNTSPSKTLNFTVSD